MLHVIIVPSNVPVSYRGKYYYRSGSTLQELTGTALTDFLMRKLPPGYTVEMLMEPHESHRRNRLMANVFYLAGFIEAWGRGYEKIRESFNN